MAKNKRMLELEYVALLGVRGTYGVDNAIYSSSYLERLYIQINHVC